MSNSLPWVHYTDISNYITGVGRRVRCFTDLLLPPQAINFTLIRKYLSLFKKRFFVCGVGKAVPDESDVSALGPQSILRWLM